MDKNCQIYGFDNCPVVSLKVMEWEYPYVPFEAKQCKGENERRNFGNLPAYIAQLIGDVMCNGKNPDTVFDELICIYKEQKSVGSLFHVFIGEWICGLVLAVGMPDKIYRLCALDAFDISLVRDFAAGDYICRFLKGDENCDDKLLSALRVLSEYDFTKSLYYRENREIYQKAVCAALPVAMKRVLSERGKGFFIPERKRICKPAFPGLPCSDECSKKLETEYIPFSENTELRIFITAIIKHIDNLIRQGLGIKSKLVGFTLTQEYRRLVADTIRKEIPGFLPAPSKVGRKPKEKNENIRKSKSNDIQTEIYEPLNLSIDFSKAKKLEAESWKLTSLIGVDYGGSEISIDTDEFYAEREKDEDKTPETFVNENEKPSLQSADSDEEFEKIPEEWAEFFSLLTNEEKMVLSLVARGKDAEEAIKKNGGMLKGFADTINEKAYDAYGDIIIETVGRRLEFIEDYKDELTNIFYALEDAEVL